MSEDPSNADAPSSGGQVALLSDPVDVIIDKLLRYVAFRRGLERFRSW